MVEKLATDNLMLEERNRELQEAIEDLESMRTMDEEMLESQRDVERDLRFELESSAAKMNEVGNLHKLLSIVLFLATRTIEIVCRTGG